MATRSHQFASVGIRLAFEKQFGDAMLQRIDFRLVGFSTFGRKRRQLGDIALDSLGKVNLGRGSGFFAHDLMNANAEVGQCLNAVLSSLRCAAADTLGGECLDFFVGLAIVKRSDLSLHLAHLRLEVAQFLKELP